MSSDQIISGVNPTRMVLLELKGRKKLAEDGHDLLKRKLETLTNELFNILREYSKIESKTREALQEAMKSLVQAEIAVGPIQIREIALNYPELVTADIETRSLMGVRVPVIKTIRKEKEIIPYSLIETSGQLDASIDKFEQALDSLLVLAELQSTISRLAIEVNATKRRVNALKNIIIPRVDATIRFIVLALQEREREDFVRLKKIKARLEKQAQVF
ncbi:MAG: V-type ATP synthase subunit D [Candidatus Hodarchaeales archaeon]|jgi:V/A-type H+-transporting ATPase subunit D